MVRESTAPVDQTNTCRLYSNAERPCSTCWRTYRKAVRANPQLKDTPLNCTYDQATELTWEEDQMSQQNLEQLETRVGVCLDCTIIFSSVSDILP